METHGKADPHDFWGWEDTKLIHLNFAGVSHRSFWKCVWNSPLDIPGIALWWISNAWVLVNLEWCLPVSGPVFTLPCHCIRGNGS